MKSKVIAISAFASAFSALFLTIGAYFEFFDLIGVVFASVFTVLPIYFNSYKGCFLSYLAGGIIAFIFSGFNIFSIVFIMYFLFFGLFPTIKYISTDKNFNKTIFNFVSIIWCILSAIAVYYYYLMVLGESFFTGLPQFFIEYAIVFVILFGVVVYFVFNRFVSIARILINHYLRKIIK